MVNDSHNSAPKQKPPLAYYTLVYVELADSHPFQSQRKNNPEIIKMAQSNLSTMLETHP